MTVRDIFELRRQGKIEEAYDAIRPMYRVHKGYYTSLCMYHCAKDVFHLRLAEGRLDEASKIYQALKRLVLFIDDRDGSVAKFMAEGTCKLEDARRHSSNEGENELSPFNSPLGSAALLGKELSTVPDSKLQRLLEVVKGEMSVREMMAALGFASRDKFLKNYLSPALKSGLIEMTQPDSPKSPTQRYRKAK
jgi:hypothetical protein